MRPLCRTSDLALQRLQFLPATAWSAAKGRQLLGVGTLGVISTAVTSSQNAKSVSLHVRSLDVSTKRRLSRIGPEAAVHPFSAKKTGPSSL